MGINIVIQEGTVCGEISFKETFQHKPVLKFCINNCMGKKKNSDSWLNNYFNIICFGDHAEKIAPLIQKKVKVVVEGKLNYNEWKDENKVKHNNISIISHNIKIINNGVSLHNDKQDSGEDMFFDNSSFNPNVYSDDTGTESNF